MEKTGRIDWIDGLRGIAMLLVVSGHCLGEQADFFAFTNSVKMPLFFAISGYLFKDSSSFIELIKKLGRRIVVPWICIGLFITTCLAIVQKGSLYIYWFDMINGEGIWWFLPCFFWGEIIHSRIRNYFKNESLLVLISFILFFLGCFLYEFELLNFMMLNRALVVQLFFCFGYIIKKNEPLIISWGGVKYCLLSIYVLGCLFNISQYSGHSIDVRANIYFDINFNMIMMTVGVFMTFMLAFSFKHYPRFLLFVGRNTFPIYIFHYWIIIILGKGMASFNIIIINSWLYGFILFVISTLLSCVISGILNRYSPWLVGKNKVLYI